MSGRFYHAATGFEIQFSTSPLRGSAEQIERVQSSGYDSAGIRYVYSRTAVKRRSLTLIYPQQSITVVNSLLGFVQARGDKDTFEWDDHNSVAHTCRFTTPHVRYTETGPGRWRVEIDITEET